MFMTTHMLPISITRYSVQIAVAISIVLTVSLTAQANTVVTFTNSNAATAQAGACSGIGWTAGTEFRVCDSSGTGLAIEASDVIIGGEFWAFDNGLMVSVSELNANSGGITDPSTSAAPITLTHDIIQRSFDPGLGAGPLTILAPTAGSAAGNSYGVGTYNLGAPSNGTYSSIFTFPVLELQWAGATAKLGQSTGGVTFSGTLFGCVTTGLVTDCKFDLYASALLEGVGGLVNTTAQWHLEGASSLVYTASAVPLPATTWLLVSGLLGLLGITRSKNV